MQTRVQGEGLAREVLPGLASNSVAEHTTGRHDGEKKGGDNRNKELKDAGDERERVCFTTANSAMAT